MAQADDESQGIAGRPIAISAVLTRPKSLL
jgi:hypothetical protein